MLTAIKDKEAYVVIIEYKDRLARFGYKYLEKYIEGIWASLSITNFTSVWIQVFREIYRR